MVEAKNWSDKTDQSQPLENNSPDQATQALLREEVEQLSRQRDSNMKGIFTGPRTLAPDENPLEIRPQTLELHYGSGEDPFSRKITPQLLSDSKKLKD